MATDGIHSVENSSIHPITALPQGEDKEDGVRKRRGVGEWGREIELGKMWQQK